MVYPEFPKYVKPDPKMTPHDLPVEFKKGFLLLSRNALIIGRNVEIRIGNRMTPCLT